MNGIKQCMSTEGTTFDEDVYVRKERFINGMMIWFNIGDYCCLINAVSQSTCRL